MFSNLARLTIGAVVVISVAACAPATGEHDTGEPVIGSVPKLLASADLRLPAQDYLQTNQQSERLGRARLALIQRCLARFGVDYAVEQVSSAGYGPRSLTDRRYGITDAELAARAGFGLGERDPSLQPQPARPDVGPDGQAALFGDGPSQVLGIEVPSGGCVGEADRAINRAVPAGADPQLGHKLQFESFELSKKDSRVRDAFAAWSLCMAEVGYRYPDPLAAAADPRFTGPEVSAEQIAVARADIGCKEETNLVGVWFTVESAYQQREIERNSAAFAACKEAIAARQRAATAVESQK
jgi:hypothetical protein